MDLCGENLAEIDSYATASLRFLPLFRGPSSLSLSLSLFLRVVCNKCVLLLSQKRTNSSSLMEVLVVRGKNSFEREEKFNVSREEDTTQPPSHHEEANTETEKEKRKL